MIKAIPVALVMLAVNATLWGQATKQTTAPRAAAATAHKSSTAPKSSGSLLNLWGCNQSLTSGPQERIFFRTAR